MTRKFGLIGANIGYSRSKIIFEDIVKDDATYEIVDVNEISRELLLRYDGLNVTTPYKVEVMSYLDDVDGVASKIGSVNCIKNDNRYLIGYNTDYYGFGKCISDSIKSMIVLGNGGVVKTIKTYCLNNNIALVVCGREESKNYYDMTYNELNMYKCLDVDCIVNATKHGCLPPIEYNNINENTFVFDLAYNIDGSKTDFMKKCEENGIKNIIDGRRMLHWQAIKSYEIWKIKF